jgi:hypothetical protein
VFAVVEITTEHFARARQVQRLLATIAAAGDIERLTVD